MKKTYVTTLSKHQCQSFIRETTDLFALNIGMETLTGWSLFGFFSISWRSGKIRPYNAVFVKATGRISEKNGVTKVAVRIHKGLTDAVSVLSVFALSFLIIWWVSEELSLLSLTGLAALCCILSSLITWLFTNLSEEGREGEEQLNEFLERGLKLQPQGGKNGTDASNF